MSTQYRLVQSGKTASGGYSAGQGSSEPVAPRIIIIIIILFVSFLTSALDGVSVQRLAPAAFTPGEKPRYALHRRLGWPQI
jgi:hypothetical protein